MVFSVYFQGLSLTAVAGSAANHAESATACSSAEAQAILRDLCYEARGGDRSVLVSLHALVLGHDELALHRVSTTQLEARLAQAVDDGRLLFLRRIALLPESDASSPENRLSHRIMAGKPFLSFEGSAYRVMPAASWNAIDDKHRYEAVHSHEASSILGRMSTHHTDAGLRTALQEAAAQLLTQAQTRARGTGLVLARHFRSSGARAAPVAAAVTPSAAARARAASAKSPPAPALGHLIVRLRTPMGTPIAGVTVDVAGLPSKRTAGNGEADFGNVPVGTYNADAHKADYGPIPAAGGVFAVGHATGSQAVTAGNTSTLDLQLVTPGPVTVTHTPVVAATPLRIYKAARGDLHVDHIVVCTALCPRAPGNGPGTQIPVRIDWTFTPDGVNAPKANGGKDNTDLHFGAAPGFAMSGGGTTTGSTVTSDAGRTEVMLRASVTSGDAFVVHARILRAPANPAAGDMGHADSPRFEVWKRLDYQNLYRMQTGANLGFDLAAISTPANIQPAFTPAFTEFTVGAPHPVAYREYITALVAPTAAQLPLSGPVRVRSDGADVRAVTVTGLVVAADGSTSAGADVVVLANTANVAGARQFQKITHVSVAPLAGRTVTIETAAGAAIASIAPRRAGGAVNFLFDAAVSVQAKAQAWYDANQHQLGVDMAALNASIGAAGYFMVGAAYYHPKLDGRPATGVTSYYAGYPGVQIHYYTAAFHPDAQWGNVDGVNQGSMSCLFLNVGGGAYASMVARHEIGHASDHVSYGPGDHCPQATCLMYAFSQQNQFCTIGRDHSLRRTEGWTP